MPDFTFVARDPSGRPQQGTLEAATRTAVLEDLRGRGWLVVKIAPAAPDAASIGVLQTISPSHWMPIRSIDVEIGFSQLAVMLRGGLSLLNALNTVEENTVKTSMRRVWRTVARRIQEGASFASAIREHRCFPILAVHLIRVGEQTGNLDMVVDRAAETMRNRRQLMASLFTALAYPTIVLLAALGVSAFMIIKVIPALRVFLTAMGRRMPPMTQALLDVSNWFQVHGLFTLMMIVFLSLAAITFYAWPPGRGWVDRWLLRLPVVGKLLRLGATVSLSRAMGILLRSGITLLDALRTLEQLHKNRYLSDRLSDARNSVMGGGDLASSLSVEHAWMPMLSRMVAVGETAGTLDDILDEVAEFHEGQLQTSIKRLSAIVEPAIIVVVGGIVGFVYGSFFMALFAAGGA